MATSAKPRNGSQAAPPASAAATRPPPPGEAAAPPKARLRGAIHHYAFFVAVAVGIMLILDAQTTRARLGCIVYTISTANMFGTSALYHRPTWNDKGRALMRRLDHAGIFGLIAGTNTPLSLLALAPRESTKLLSLVWGGAGLGMAQCLFFSHAPKALASTLYVALGWATLPFLKQYNDVLPAMDVWLIVAGGVLYSIGAVIYARKSPDPFPLVFGYHEIFHTLVTLAALLHFIAVYRLVNSPLGARNH